MRRAGSVLMGTAGLLLAATILGALHDSHAPWEAYAYVGAVTAFVGGVVAFVRSI